MAPLLIQEAGSDEQHRRWLPGIADGKTLLSVIAESPTLADGKLSGSTMFATDGSVADAFLVFADDGASGKLAIVPADRPGIQTTALETVDDTRRTAEVAFEGVEVGEDDVLSTGDAARAIARALEAGRVMLAADALGVAQEGLRIAVEYAKQREQFNRVIASFQAVKHL